MNTKIALITTVNDKNCTYLIKHLLNKGYKVHGIRNHPYLMKDRLANFFQYHRLRDSNYIIHDIEEFDTENLLQLFQKIKPNKIFNLVSKGTLQKLNGTFKYIEDSDKSWGTQRILAVVRMLRLAHETKIYQVFTSELQCEIQEVKETENLQVELKKSYSLNLSN